MKNVKGLILSSAACAILAPCLALLAADPPAPTTFPSRPTPPVHSPEAELKTIQLHEGYRLELVLSDPEIKEPVQCVFDADGRMYVAEMRSYMQDIDAKGEHDQIGRVSRHESSKGDGVFDKHTLYADNLLLPRMIQPLRKGDLLVGETDTNDIHLYHDTKYTGSADGRDLFYAGGPRPGNLEHQPSGLVWSMDNWIYTTYNPYRLRWTPKGLAIKDATTSNGGQWGLCQDDNGKLWWSNGGGEKGLWHFQTHVLYASMDVKDQFSPSFMEVWPLVAIPDVQGGTGRFRPVEKTLNHFTACGGQEIFRGDRLPPDLRGNALICEPVGRLIRRAKVEVKDGVTTLSNPYEAEKSEFIRSTDPYFRPVNMTTGPDGCLYIVDMYRGIIQEGNWTKQGSYLRKVVEQYGLQNNVSHGRIWRLVHKDFKPGPQPRMYEESSSQLVAHLEHPNGWWRDTAQKLLVLRQDQSVVSELQKLARGSKNPVTRMHALWTLEGLGAADLPLVGEALKDSSPEVRSAAIRISETLFKAGEESVKDAVLPLVKDSDPNVALQAMMTAKLLKWPDWQRVVTLTVLASQSHGVQEIGKQLLYVPKTFDPKQFTGDQVKLLNKGQGIYQELCFACHGYDGKGMPLDGKPPGTTIAPALSGSRLIVGPKEAVIAVLLDGLGGPVEGKTYDAQMIPMKENSDEWIAAVASYVRNSFDNSATPITTTEVERMRAALKNRTEPWTEEQLAETVLPRPLPSREKWKLSASANVKTAPQAVDGKMETRYSTNASQTAGQWFMVELPEETSISGVLLDAANSRNDYPHGYQIDLSKDGVEWGKPISQGKGSGAVMVLTFPPTTTKFVRITQTAEAKGTFWSIHELQLLQPSKMGNVLIPPGPATKPSPQKARPAR